MNPTKKSLPISSRDAADYRDLNKRTNKEVRKDIRKYEMKAIEYKILDNANMRVLKSKFFPGKHKIIKMKN